MTTTTKLPFDSKALETIAELVYNHDRLTNSGLPSYRKATKDIKLQYYNLTISFYTGKVPRSFSRELCLTLNFIRDKYYES